jgi:hypothetical protein
LLWLVTAAAVAAVIAYWMYVAFSEPSDAIVNTNSTQPRERTVTRSGHSSQSRPRGADDENSEFSSDPDQRLASVQDGRTIEMCHWALTGAKYLEAPDCDRVPAEDAERLAYCLSTLAGRQKDLEYSIAKAAGCPSALISASVYYIALRDAALAGDLNAQECFVSGYFHDRNSGNSITEEQEEEYVPLARQFIQSAFERGDWGVVNRLAGTWVDNPGLLIRAYPYGMSDLETFYKMNYLLTLGARDKINSDDALGVVSATRRNGRLSAAQMKAAEDWARETYARYFAGTVYEKKAAAASFCESD